MTNWLSFQDQPYLNPVKYDKNENKKVKLSIVVAMDTTFPQSREPGAPDADGFIHDPRENDVLCGRGGAALRHPGNQTYRRLVNLNKGLYSTCLKTEKLKISRSIVAAIREQQGRFLEKAPNREEAWLDIGDKKAVEKTSQALREGQPKLRQKIAEMGGAGAAVDPFELSSYAADEGGGSTGGDINMTMQGQMQQHRQQLLNHQRQELLQEQQRQAALELLQQQQHRQRQEQQYRQDSMHQPQDMFRGHGSGSFDSLPSAYLNGSNHSCCKSKNFIDACWRSSYSDLSTSSKSCDSRTGSTSSRKQ